MRDYYYIGVAKIIGTDRKVLVKMNECYMSNGSIVEFRINDHKNIAEVISASIVLEGSTEEEMFNAVSSIYEVEKVYGISWEKKKEDQEDGN